MREKLAKLLEDSPYLSTLYNEKEEFLKAADHLLANGVIVPPCKVGDMVWFISDRKIIETKVDKVVLKHGGLYLLLSRNSFYETTCRSIGKTVFLTKEEAEKALEERREQ